MEQVPWGAVKREDLRDMVDRIVDTVDPVRIVLFGSRARGDETEHSDTDLLVELETVPEGRTRMGLMTDLQHELGSIRGAKDILVYETADVEKWRATTNHVIARAVREGEVLYERS